MHMFKLDTEAITEAFRVAVHNTTNFDLQKILIKAQELQKLSFTELAFLLQQNTSAELKKIYATAYQIKQITFGKEITFFAPLYISNECVNECVYCAFRIGNTTLSRKTLSEKEIIHQANFLAQRGFRRVQLVFGEHPKASSVDFIIQCVELILTHTPINEITINCAPLTIEQFKKLAEKNINHYQLYQETYDAEAYNKLHLKGPKRVFKNRLEVMDRAVLGGMKYMGLGILLGLADPLKDILALLMHARYLEETYTLKIASLSVPRLRPAHGSEYSIHAKYGMNDDEFKKMVAVLRIAFPSTHISISTRERPALRDELINIGVSKMSAESKTNPGGYGREEQHNGEQFIIEDTRTLDEIKQVIKEKKMVAVY